MESLRREQNGRIQDRVGALALCAALIKRAERGALSAEEELAIARALQRAGLTAVPGVDAQLRALVSYFLRRLWSRSLDGEESQVANELPRA